MKVFISSVYEDSRAAGDERHLAIRRRLCDEGEKRGHEMWVAEYTHRQLTRRTPWRQVVDACVDGVVASDLFVALLYRRWGSAVEVDRAGPSSTSFLEIELFQAAMRKVPVFFFEVAGFEQDAELMRLVTILKSMTRADQWQRVEESKLERTVLGLIDAVAAGKASPRLILALPDALSDDRSFRRVSRELRSTRLSFLSGFGPTAERGSVSTDLVNALLRDAERTPTDAPLNYPEQLSRLWMALRELSKVPPDALTSKMISDWIDLTDMWRGSAAWLRWHGPVILGALAALQTRTDLNRRYPRRERMPFGAFASEAYSIGKVSTTWQWKSRRFDAARRLATEEAAGSHDPSGAWLIRASATMQLARVGRPWLAFRGREDYAAALGFRQKHGARNSAIGEAMSELAFADFAIGRLFFWKRTEALDRLREGVRLLESDHPESRPGFVRRAKEKLAVALDAHGDKDEALAHRVQLVDLSRLHGVPPL